MCLREAYSLTLPLQSLCATCVIFTFSFNFFGFILLLGSSLRHIFLARRLTASRLTRSVHLITRVSKTYSRSGFRTVSMRRPMLLSVTLFKTRVGLSSSIAILVLEMRALIAFLELPSDNMMLPK